jgi:hypothetical protein
MTNALASQIVPEREKRMQREAPGVAASLLEGLDELLTVNRLGLPLELRRALACTNAIENMQGTIRRVTRNVKRWRDASMALRWVAAGMMEAQAGFRRLKAISPANCRLSDGPSPTTPDIREHGIAARVARAPRPRERPEVTSNLPEGNFLLRASLRHACGLATEHRQSTRRALMICWQWRLVHTSTPANRAFQVSSVRSAHF